VDPQRVQRMEALVRRHVPDLRLVEKVDSPLMRLLGRVLQPINPDFMDKYTTVIGSTIYLPCPKAEFPPDALAQTLAHELVHQLDMQAFGPLFYVSYVVTPLPVWRTHRAYWVRRGYAVDLMLAYHIGGEARLAAVESWIRGVFAGPAYGWMWGGRSPAARFLKPVVEEVRSGELQQRFPYREVLEAWTNEDVRGS